MSRDSQREGLLERTGTIQGSQTDDQPNGDVVERSEDGVYYATHDMTRDGLCTTIALALSEVTDVEAATLVSDFSEYADPDALNRLFRTRPGGERFPGGTVLLRIQGHRIQIDTDGRIAITPDCADSDPTRQ